MLDVLVCFNRIRLNSSVLAVEPSSSSVSDAPSEYLIYTWVGDTSEYLSGAL